MKSLYHLLLLFILSSTTVLACPGEESNRHANPDGSLGGFVSSRAKVDPQAYVGFHASVCGTAWVESDVKIDGYASIGEDAWIRKFVEVSGRARIKGRAVLEGSSSHFSTIVEDDVQIEGEAKILAGSHLSGKTKVFGSPVLRAVTSDGETQICGGYILTNENLSDSDYFCNEGKEKSRGQIFIEDRYLNQTFRSPSQKITIKLDQDQFSKISSAFNIVINGSRIDDEDFYIQGNLLVIERTDLFIDGENLISFEGLDNFGKTLSEELSFIAGTQNFSLSLGSDAVFSPIQLTLGDETILIHARKKSDGWYFENVPEMLNQAVLSFAVVTGDGYAIYEGRFQDLASNFEIIPHSAPSTIDNNDFSLGLSGWEVSHPGQVQIEDFAGNKRVVIDHDNDDIIELKRTYKTHLKTIQFSLLPLDLSFMMNEERKFDILIYGKRGKKIFFKRPTFDPENSSEMSDLFDFGKNELDEEVTFVVRFYPPEYNKTTQSKTEVKQRAVGRSVKVDFVNPTFLLFKATTVGKILDLDPSSSDYCSNPIYDITNVVYKDAITTEGNKIGLGPKVIVDSLTDPLSFLSVGLAPIIHPQIENHLYGNLSTTGVKTSEIERIFINLKFKNSNDMNEEIEIPLTSCAQGKTEFRAEKNLAKYLARMDWTLMQRVPTDREQTMTLRPVLKLRNNPKLILGNTTKVKLLRALSFDDNDTYRDPSKIDYYDSDRKNLVRTGGDKWIRPTIGSRIENVLPFIRGGVLPEWKINDTARINGGMFLGHQTHEDGQDVDISFDENDRDNIPQFVLVEGKKEENYRVLKHVEDFLGVLYTEFNYIRDIYLTAQRNSEAYNYFHHSCIWNRVIDLEAKGNGTGTLLANKPNHLNHLHIRYNSPDSNQGMKQITPPSFGFDRTQFWYGYKNGKFKVEPKEEFKDSFKDIKIKWVIRDSEKRENSTFLEFGTYKGTALNRKSKNSGDNQEFIKQRNLIGVRYVDIVLENTNGNGGCVGGTIQFDYSKLCRTDDENQTIEDWTFHPYGGQVSRNAFVDSGYFFRPGAYACNTVNISGSGQSIDDMRYEGSVELNGSIGYGVGGNHSVVRGTGEIVGQFTADHVDLEADFDLAGIFYFRENTVVKSLNENLVQLKINSPEDSWYDASIINDDITSDGNLILENTHVKAPITNDGKLVIEGYDILGPLQNEGKLSLDRAGAIFSSLNNYLVNTGDGITTTLFRATDINGVTAYNYGSIGSGISVVSSRLGEDISLNSYGYGGISIYDGDIVSNRTIFSPYSCSGISCNYKKSELDVSILLQFNH